MAFPLFERAVNSIKSQVPLDLDLDVDNDGCIDYITFVMPGSIVYGNWILHPNQFCMAGNKTLKINGKKVYNYNVQVEEQLHDTKYVRAGY